MTWPEARGVRPLMIGVDGWLFGLMVVRKVLDGRGRGELLNAALDRVCHDEMREASRLARLARPPSLDMA